MSKWTRTPESKEVVFYSDAEHIVESKQHAYDWNNQYFGQNLGGSLESQINTPLSPTGELPATGYLCSYTCTPDVLQSIQDYAKQVNTHLEIIVQSKGAFLQERGLKEIET